MVATVAVLPTSTKQPVVKMSFQGVQCVVWVIQLSVQNVDDFL